MKFLHVMRDIPIVKADTGSQSPGGGVNWQWHKVSDQPGGGRQYSELLLFDYIAVVGAMASSLLEFLIFAVVMQ